MEQWRWTGERSHESALGRAIVNMIKELGPEIKATFGADGFLLIALLLLFVLLGIIGLPG